MYALGLLINLFASQLVATEKRDVEQARPLHMS